MFRIIAANWAVYQAVLQVCWGSRPKADRIFKTKTVAVSTNVKSKEYNEKKVNVHIAV